MPDNPFVGSWTYRSFIADPDVNTPFDKLEFGRGTIVFTDAPSTEIAGTIGGPGWSLALTGARSYGNPMTCWFQGKGMVGGAEWTYDYVGYMAPHWPNGRQQRPAIVGTIVRAIPHPGSGKGSVAPAGVVAQRIAVRQDD